MFNQKVQDEIQKHYDKLVELGYNVVGVFLYGSQNYELDYEGSDVDSKAIVLPTLNDIVLNKQPISTTVDMGDNCLCDVKDIRKMFECFKKQNINFVELLFTKYYILNPEYRELYLPMLDNNELIARYNNYASLNCMSGMALEKYNALTHPYPSIKDKIDKYGYDCYSSDTLFLTNNGLKYYEDISSNDLLGTMNPINECLEFQSFTNRIKKETTDSLYEIETYDSRFCITENHNIFTSRIKINKNGHKYKKSESNWKLESLHSVLKDGGTHRHLFAFPYNDNIDYDIDDNWLKLCGLYLSDGTINFGDKEQNNIRSLRLTQNKLHRSDFHIMSDNLLEYYGGSYYYDKNKNDCIWIFNKVIAKSIYDECGHKSKDKHLPSFYLQLSERQCRILLHSLMLGDGTFGANRDIYYTSNYSMAKEILVLSFMAGNHSVLMGGKDGYKSEGGYGEVKMYHISIKKRKLSPSYFNLKKGINGNIKNIIKGSKEVVCFEVPNGLLVTMNNGKMAVQGNCKQFHHILRMKEFMERYIDGEKYSDILIPYEKGMLLAIKKEYIYSVDEAKSMCKATCDYMKQLKDDYMLNNPVNINQQAIEIMDEVCYNTIRHSIRKEIL